MASGAEHSSKSCVVGYITEVSCFLQQDLADLEEEATGDHDDG